MTDDEFYGSYFGDYSKWFERMASNGWGSGRETEIRQKARLFNNFVKAQDPRCEVLIAKLAKRFNATKSEVAVRIARLL